jgi:peptidoglycan/xylan/chitin deacetylase (PgdA/CDA1 family)
MPEPDELTPRREGAQPSRARRLAKALGLTALQGTGLVRLSDVLSCGRIRALTYHRVVERPQRAQSRRPSNTVYSDEFAAQMSFVARNYQVPSADDLRAIIEGRKAAPRGCVAITFDDGYENNLLHAVPILRRLGLHAIVFVTTNFIGKPTQSLWFDRLDALLAVVPCAELVPRLRQLHRSFATVTKQTVRVHFKRTAAALQTRVLTELENVFRPPVPDRSAAAPMSWDQVRETVAQGITIGSHTANHQILAAVSPDEALRELTISRERIEAEIQRPCWCFAYPNGTREDFRIEDEAAVAQAGYSCAFTQISGSFDAATPRYRLPRIPIPENGDLRVFRLHVSGLRRRLGG